jgi:DNA-binding beta-propeller fold protein YncE
MSRSKRFPSLRVWVLAVGVGALIVIPAHRILKAQEQGTSPYRVSYDWPNLGIRKIGVASGIRMDPDGKHLWILDRCGANGCADSDLDPIIEVDMEGNLVTSFGKGQIAFPHGFFVDKDGNIWVTDGAAKGDPRAEAGLKKHKGHQVYKFSHDGKLLMTLGTAGVPGDDQTHMNGPTGVVVSADGDIWVTDGHGGPQTGPNKENMFGSRGGNNRLIRFSADGKFKQQWGGGIGSEGHGPLEFNDPHGIDIDPSTGRIYIADRGNDRIQVIDSNGKFITQWLQYGKPSAIAFDNKGNAYVADGMSNDHWNPGWERGIRVGDIKTGWVKAFIPDEELSTIAGTEFLGVDVNGTIYSGASGRPGLVVHRLFRPLWEVPPSYKPGPSSSPF